MLFRRKIWFKAVIGLGAIILALLIFPWRGVKIFLEPPLAYISKITYGVTTSLKAWSEVNFLLKDNESLRQQVATLSTQNVALELCQQTIVELKKLSAISESVGFKQQGVEVIGEQVDDTGQSYIISRGRTSGLRIGTPLVAGLDNSSMVLVGIVTQVNEQTASFRLATAHGNQVLAQVVNTTRSPGVAVGEFNLAIRLKFVPLDEELIVGGPVVTSNLDPLVPPGLFIGRISEITKVSGDFWQSAVVVPPVFLERFRFLYALTAL